MNARKIRAAVADISADTGPTRKAAKLASLCLPAAPSTCARVCQNARGGRPEYRILAECKALVREAANELKLKSPLDPD
jgi:hypothetical protein